MLVITKHLYLGPKYRLSVYQLSALSSIALIQPGSFLVFFCFFYKNPTHHFWPFLLICFRLIANIGEISQKWKFKDCSSSSTLKLKDHSSSSMSKLLSIFQPQKRLSLKHTEAWKKIHDAYKKKRA